MKFTIPAAFRYKYNELRGIICVGDLVEYRDEYGRLCAGVVTQIGKSPYVGEEDVLRAYVEVNETYFDEHTDALWHVDAVAAWCLWSELTLVKAGYVEYTEAQS